MGRLYRYLGRLGFAGVGGVLISVAYNLITQFYPLTEYAFFTAGVARVLFWISVGIGILGLLCIGIALFKSSKSENIPAEIKMEATPLEDIKSDLINMNKYEREVAIEKVQEQRPSNIAKQIHDDFVAIIDIATFISIIQSAIKSDIDPLLDFFKKFGDILDANEYGLKVELENKEQYKLSKLDLAQKRLKLRKTKSKNAIIQKNINRILALTYGGNSSIILRGILRSLPKGNGIVNPAIRIVLVGLEDIESVIDKNLTDGLNNLENEWKPKLEFKQLDMSQLEALLDAVSKQMNK